MEVDGDGIPDASTGRVVSSDELDAVPQAGLEQKGLSFSLEAAAGGLGPSGGDSGGWTTLACQSGLGLFGLEFPEGASGIRCNPAAGDCDAALHNDIQLAQGLRTIPVSFKASLVTAGGIAVDGKDVCFRLAGANERPRLYLVRQEETGGGEAPWREAGGLAAGNAGCVLSREFQDTADALRGSGGADLKTKCCAMNGAAHAVPNAGKDAWAPGRGESGLRCTEGSLHHSGAEAVLHVCRKMDKQVQMNLTLPGAVFIMVLKLQEIFN
ncbi:MAG: hypothetical protein K6C33_09855 [Desulfovibrio sp.]|nr:hypothetical protein [Desulfovibrio sp.]